MRPIWRFLIGQAVVLVLLLSLPWLVIDKVPGVIKPTAAVLCPADKPDAYVVEYYTDTGRGQGTSNSLVCMGPDGDITEVGSWAPLGVLFGAMFLAVELLVLPLQVLGIVRRRRRGGQDAPGRPIDPGGRRIQLGRAING